MLQFCWEAKTPNQPKEQNKMRTPKPQMNKHNYVIFQSFQRNGEEKGSGAEVL